MLALIDSALLEQFLAGVLPPALFASAALVAAWKPWQRERDGLAANARWGAPLALGLGYAAGHIALEGSPPLRWALDVKQGLFYLALAGMVFGFLESWRPRTTWPIRAGRALLSVAAPLFLLDFMRDPKYHWGPVEALLWNAALALGLFLAWCALEALAERRPGAALPWAWIAVGTLLSGALSLAGSVSLGQLAGALTAPLGTVALLAWWRSDVRLSGGGVAPFALVFAGLTWAGHYSSGLSGASAILLGGALLAPWLVELPGLRTLGPVPRAVLTVVLALVPATAALALERSGQPDRSAPEDPYANYRPTR